MPKGQRVSVIGAGSWGTAVANVFADNGCDVVLWGRDPLIIESIEKEHRNKKYLPGAVLSPKLRATCDLESCIRHADIVVGSIPTQQVRQVFQPMARLMTSKIVVNTSKGIEIGTHALVSQIFREIAPESKYAILSGPSFAAEVVQRLPTAVTVASRDREHATLIQQTMATQYFRVYTSTDVVGIELAGALKNVIAIASGIVAGLGLGYNAQAALINRGIAEIMRMAKKLGAEPLTFLGLAGMGDLILTCTGPLSRNRKLGVGLGEGKRFAGIQKELGGVAEGYYTARSAYEFGKTLDIDMPITEQVYRILYEGSTPQRALTELMNRDLKPEW